MCLLQVKENLWIIGSDRPYASVDVAVCVIMITEKHNDYIKNISLVEKGFYHAHV